MVHFQQVGTSEQLSCQGKTGVDSGQQALKTDALFCCYACNTHQRTILKTGVQYPTVNQVVCTAENCLQIALCFNQAGLHIRGFKKKTVAHLIRLPFT